MHGVLESRSGRRPRKVRLGVTREEQEAGQGEQCWFCLAEGAVHELAIGSSVVVPVKDNGGPELVKSTWWDPYVPTWER